MKAIFITEDEKETKRLAKSLDMALFIWELLNRAELSVKSLKEINTLLFKNNIDIYDLIE